MARGFALYRIQAVQVHQDRSSGAASTAATISPEITIGPL
jgi:hypothetical protein